jgi:hypothetical protein
MTSENRLLITKAGGEKEEFNEEKLRCSLRRARAKSSLIEEVVGQVTGALRDDMTTADIYKHAYTLLESLERPVASRYSLRRALSALGPSGFPFEYFIGRLLERLGYTVVIGQMVRGACATHEVDVIARNSDKIMVSELKFHHNYSTKSDMKVGLYVSGRFDDIEKGGFAGIEPQGLPVENWLITNTKFTTNLIDYAKCSGLKLLSWGYPKGENLQELIERANVHPLTCLSSLNEREKRLLLDEGVVLCRSIIEDQGRLQKLGLDEHRMGEVVGEADALCNPPVEEENLQPA